MHYSKAAGRYTHFRERLENVKRFSFFLDSFKMSLKSKKKLTFCTAEKDYRLKLRNNDEKQFYAQKFNQHFNFISTLS